MKKNIFIFVLGLFLMAPGSSFGDTIVFAIGEWPPFIGETLPDYGFHTKIVKKVFTEMGHEIEFEFLPWKRAYEMTKKGRYLATFSWNKTPERQEEMFYPENELALSKEVGFYKKSRFPNGLTIKTIEDIKNQNLKVVGIASYWYEKAFKDMGINLHIVSTAGSAWKMLNANRVDLMIENSDVGKAESQAALGQGKDAEFGVTSPLRTGEMFILFSRVHPKGKEIMNQYDATVSKLKAAGKL